MALTGTALVSWIVQVAIAFAVVPFLTAPPLDRFRSSFFEFSLAKGWQCTAEAATFVCSPLPPRDKSAIIILAQKYRNKEDNVNVYMEYLKKPKELRIQNKSIISTVKYVRVQKIGRHDWVDALHFQSEVPNYNTRYLIATTSHLSILITFSVYSDKHQDRTMQEFENMVVSLKIHQGRFNASQE